MGKFGIEPRVDDLEGQHFAGHARSDEMCIRDSVNIVEGGGMYGFDGLRRLAELMEEAYRTERDARDFIQQKGLGCDSCL